VIVKSVLLYAELATTTPVVVYAAQSSPAANGVMHSAPLAAFQSVQEEIWVMLEAGDTVHGSFPVAGVNVWISGTVLPVPG
jgi:hypothetical protein